MMCFINVFLIITFVCSPTVTDHTFGGPPSPSGW